ncbi:MAG TPA: RNA polymerase sigma factor [Polyangia bacterium]|jgi:RNA polymerase sigma-70 factor (ECF subfamily)|nr:RNA polymerase sigma factor [Polyangia bacterium]
MVAVAFRKPDAESAPGREGVEEICVAHMDFVWRNLRRLGVHESSIDDAVQDVFLVVHRRLVDFEERSQMKTWLFGILLRVAATYRRSVQRRRERIADTSPVPLESVAGPDGDGPLELVAKRQARELLHRLLGELDDDKRAMLVSVDLEQMSVPEAAESLGINLNTAYSRLRAARAAFNEAVARVQMAAGLRAAKAGT